jgi:hypothetical protein
MQRLARGRDHVHLARRAPARGGRCRRAHGRCGAARTTAAWPAQARALLRARVAPFNLGSGDKCICIEELAAGNSA